MSVATTPEEVLATCEDKMKKAIAATQHDMASVRTGRANPLLLERVVVDYYGTMTPISQAANVSVQGGQSLIIKPYDKGLLGPIEKAIAMSELNLPPNNDGEVIRLNIPPLTEDRRKEMVKLVKKMGEEGKVAIRNIRRDATSDLDKVQKEQNLSEDQLKDGKDSIQKLTDKYTAEIDKLVVEKEKDVMTV